MMSASARRREQRQEMARQPGRFKEVFLRYVRRHGYDGGVTAAHFDLSKADPLAVAQAEWDYQQERSKKPE